MTQPVPAPKKPKGMLITGIVLVVLSIIVFIGGIVWGGVAVATSVSDSPVFSAPGEVTTTLDAGEHALWTPVSGSFLFADDVTITGPGGEVTGTDYFATSGSVSVTKGNTSYSPEVTFTAPTTGSYTVVVAEGGPATDVLVGPPSGIVGDTFVIIAAALGIASLIGVIGLILFIVGLVKRGRAKRAGQPPMGPGGYGAPGGYPGQPAYGQQPGYGQPQPGYSQPQPGYSQPQPGYGQPQPGASQPPAYGQPPATPPPGS